MKPLRLAAVVCALFICVSAHATNFETLISGYDNLKTGASAPVSSQSYSIGHLKLTFANGTAARLMAGDEGAGIFFKGTGTFEYKSVNAVEAPVVAFNTKKQTHLALAAAEGATVLSGTFTELLLLGDGDALMIDGPGGDSLVADFIAHRDAFGHQVVGGPPSHLLIQQRLAFPAAKVATVEMRAGRDMLTYTYDGAVSHDETLSALTHPDTSDPRFRNNLYPAALSVQPIDRDVHTPQKPPFYLTAIDYVLTADGDNAKLDVTETILRQGAQQSVLAFNMNDVAYTETGVRNYRVAAVTDVSGRPLPFHHERRDLLVSVANLGGEEVKLRFSIEGNFLVRWGGDSAWQLGTEPWFPQPGLGGQYYTIHSLVKVKKPFIAFAPGDTIRRGEEGDYNVVENSLMEPVQFAVVHAGRYNTYEQKKGDLTVRVLSYAGRNDRAGKQLSDLAFSIIDYYTRFLGPFPWKEFDIIQVNTFGYGQAPPATMFITNEAFNSIMGLENQFFSEGINERFAHEIAHQYWGHVVKMPTHEEQWLTESFAEYSAALALKKYQGDAVYNRLVRHWKADAQEATSFAPIALANQLQDSDRRLGFIKRTHLLYGKGPYLLSVIHKEIGDQMFLSFMKSYQKSFRWKFGTTNDVAGLLQFVTKKDYKPFFEKYFWGTAMPD